MFSLQVKSTCCKDKKSVCFLVPQAKIKELDQTVTDARVLTLQNTPAPYCSSAVQNVSERTDRHANTQTMQATGAGEEGCTRRH